MAEPRLHRGLRATFIGLTVNVVLTAAKFTAGVLGHSHALVADAAESLADIFSSLIVWRALVVAAEPPDEDHPYGHGKAEPLAAAIVAAMMLLAAAYITVHAGQEIRQPHSSPAAFTLVVLVIVIVIKESLFRYILKEGASVESTAVRTDAWHHRSDAISSLAAAIGITVSILGGKSFAWADDAAAIVAALVIGVNGLRLLRPAVNELMDTAPNREVVEQVRSIGQAVPGVDCIEKCLVRKVGHDYYVDMHTQVSPQMTVQCSHEIAHEIKDRIRNQIPGVRDVLVHIEPSGPGGSCRKS